MIMFTIDVVIGKTAGKDEGVNKTTYVKLLGYYVVMIITIIDR